MSINRTNSATRSAEVVSQVLLGASIITAVALAVLARANVSAIQQHLTTAFSVTNGAAVLSLCTLILSKHLEANQADTHESDPREEEAGLKAATPETWMKAFQRAETDALDAEHPIVIREDGTALTGIWLGSSQEVIHKEAAGLNCPQVYGCLLSPGQYRDEKDSIAVFTTAPDKDVGDNFFLHSTAYFTDMEFRADELSAPVSADDITIYDGTMDLEPGQLYFVRDEHDALGIIFGNQAVTYRVEEIPSRKGLGGLRMKGTTSTLAWVDNKHLYFAYVNGKDWCFVPLTLEQAGVVIMQFSEREQNG